MPIEIENQDHKKFIFPGGEVNVQVTQDVTDSPYDGLVVNADLQNSDDIMEMLLVCNALKRLGYRRLKLVIPYVPYARQDRVCNEGEAFSLEVMCDLINSLGAASVTIYDPHSDVTTALIDNVHVVEQHELISMREHFEGYVLICPDAGAEKKIQKFKKPYIMATKIRNPVTGEIERTHVYADDDELVGWPCIIVDDICDGGRTFIELGKILKEKGASRVELYVTHGIFSKGLDVFNGIIDKVYWYKNGELKWHESSSDNIVSTG